MKESTPSRARRAGLLEAAAVLVVFLSVSVGSASGQSTITVNTTDDELNSDGDCSLREAITAANTNAVVDGCPRGTGADTITFSPPGTGTITLGSTLPTITADLTIAGPGEASLTISGNNAVRVLDVSNRVLNVHDLTIANASADQGAGIRNNGRLTVTNATFSNNRAHTFQGGAILSALLSTTLIVTNSTFSGNRANSGGAAISNIGTMTVENSAFSDNHVEFNGGAMVSFGGTINDSTFSNNTAKIGGGGISNFGPMTVTRSTFFNNRADRAVLPNFASGGAISSGGHPSAALTLINSTFSGNSAGFLGGAIRNDHGLLTAVSSTFTGNSAGPGAGTGGGISSFGGTLTFRNTIVANSPVGGNCAQSGATVIDDGGNLSYPDASCPGLNADPLLLPLADNGGPTLTHALAACSPAIDAGEDVGAPDTDQRGLPRLFGPHVDIGAYESQTPANNPPVADAGQDQLVAAGPGCAADVTLHGEGSSDLDAGDTLTYVWSGIGVAASGVTPTVNLPRGAYFISLEVSDGTCSDTDEVEVIVDDLTPPTITSLTAAPNVLWPPNHEMVPVTVTASASDTCDAAPACEIVGVVSNEPISNPGGDWQVTGPLTLDLRAERLGSGSGRVYLISVACTDAAGHASTGTVAVSVPKSQGNN